MAAYTNFIAAIDLGTSHIIGMVGEKSPSGILSIVAEEKEISEGCIKRGYIYNVEEQLAELRRQAAQSRVVAIGETGLDKRAATPLTQQMELFRVSADLSEKHNLPLIIHCVKAWDELIALRRTLRPRQTWIIHGFRGGAEQARQLLRQGFPLSFGEHFHPDAVRAAYPDHLFAETDERGADIHIVYARLADALRLPLSALIAQLACNVHTHFSL